MPGGVARDGYARRGVEAGPRPPGLIEDLDLQLAVRDRVDEEMFAAKAQRPRRQARSVAAQAPRRAGRPLVADRRKAVAAQGGQAGAAHAWEIGPRNALAAADVEVQLIADHEAAAAGRLHVGPVPLAGRF
jgi:hypothetical protein